MSEERINEANWKLLFLAERNRQMFDMVIPLTVQDYINEHKSSILSESTSASFWSHYLAGNVTHARLALDEARFKGGFDDDMVDNIQTAQTRVALLADIWRAKPNKEFESLENRSCQSLLLISHAFDWRTKTELIPDIAKYIGALAGTYRGMSGVTLMSSNS